LNNFKQIQKYNFIHNKEDFLKLKNESVKSSTNKINKDEKNSNRSTKHFYKFIDIFKYIIFLNLFNNILLLNKNISFIQNKSYNIIIKIKGIGNKKVFSRSFSSENYPDEVYINGYNQSRVSYSYNLNQTDNIIELKWNNLITECGYMFHSCSGINEIDFTNFNTSNVIHMNRMFEGCSSLTSLIFSNFGASGVIYVNHMFYGCISLTSLNLSNFDISKLIDHMFENCINLEYINMLNFNEISIGSDEQYIDIFTNFPNNIVLCINKEKIINKIYPQIENKICHIEECEDNWKFKQKKKKEKKNE